MAWLEQRGGERRMQTGGTTEPDTVREAVSGLSEGMNALVRGHLALARVEATRDLKAMGRDAKLELAGVPMLLASYLLLWLGIGYRLALAVPTWASFLICAGANLLGGLVLMLLGNRRLKKQKIDFAATAAEVRRDRELATQLRERPPQLRERLH